MGLSPASGPQQQEVKGIQDVLPTAKKTGPKTAFLNFISIRNKDEGNTLERQQQFSLGGKVVDYFSLELVCVF